MKLNGNGEEGVLTRKIDIKSLIINSGAPNVNFRKMSVRKTIWDLEFSEHLL